MLSLSHAPDPNRYYISASVFMTKLQQPPFVQSKKIEEAAQIFQVHVQTSGRRVLERAGIRLRLAGEEIYDLGYLFGYNVHKIKPIVVVDPGWIIEVQVELRKSDRWWPRFKDAFFDWWSPPKVRVMLMGVVRKGEN